MMIAGQFIIDNNDEDKLQKMGVGLEAHHPPRPLSSRRVRGNARHARASLASSRLQCGARLFESP
jgi:hypothetical protein